MTPEHSPPGTTPTRRKFIKNGSMMLAGGAIGGGSLSVAQSAHVIGSDTIKIGLIGCGGRGTHSGVQRR
ncbi:MAG: twin-arginine translocation signal domain-containing protein [Rubripirellula sp.]